MTRSAAMTALGLPTSRGLQRKEARELGLCEVDNCQLHGASSRRAGQPALPLA